MIRQDLPHFKDKVQKSNGCLLTGPYTPQDAKFVKAEIERVEKKVVSEIENEQAMDQTLLGRIRNHIEADLMEKEKPLVRLTDAKNDLTTADRDAVRNYAHTSVFELCFQHPCCQSCSSGTVDIEENVENGSLPSIWALSIPD